MPRRYFRFMPVHLLWLKDRLEKGHSRAQTAKLFSQRFGGNQHTVQTYLGKHFPKNLVPENALWKYRKTAPTREQRSEKARKAAATLTPEQKSAIARKIGEGIKRAAATLTPDQRSAIARKRQAAFTSKQRSAITRKGAATLTREQRSERSRKGAATLTREQRSEKARKGAATLTPDQRSERSRKAATSRRKNLVKDVVYVEKLPLLKRLTKTEMDTKLRELSSFISVSVKRFRRRSDIEEIRGVINLAVVEALAKWDQKRNLKTLVADITKLHLIDYFGKQKKWRINEIPFADIQAIDDFIK